MEEAFAEVIKEVKPFSITGTTTFYHHIKSRIILNLNKRGNFVVYNVFI